MSNTRKKKRKQRKNVAPIFPEAVRVNATDCERFDRDLQWLEFNRRVLDLAQDPKVPLLEKLRFLIIFTSNLDEFFMKRVSQLRSREVLHIKRHEAIPIPLESLNSQIREVVSHLLDRQNTIYKKSVKPALTGAGIRLLKWKDLSVKQKKELSAYFRENIFPILTPLVFDPAHPFPFISNLSTSLGIVLQYPEHDEKIFARVKIPSTIQQWIPLNKDSSAYEFIHISELIRENLDALFPKMHVKQIIPFRVTRNAEIDFDEIEADDILELISEELKSRRFGEVVKLEIPLLKKNEWILKILKEELEISDNQIYDFPAEIDFLTFNQIASLDIPEHRYRKYKGATPVQLQDDNDIFHAMRANDILVHHPYESFGASVERMLLKAVDDPKVLAIKVTLYRTGENSRFVPALIRAAEKGKEVVCLIELKAKFDEARNILWAQQLEDAGIHVVYGIVGLKTHAKLMMVIREEAGNLQTYCHIGTGNYNPDTAKLYEDFGLFTCNPAITADVVQIFNFLTGRSLRSNYEHCLVAPVNFKQQMLAMIENEIRNKKLGKPAGIIFKCNQLEDSQIIEALYRASKAGVTARLIVRGFCCLVPQKKGLSENIRVYSLLGRFLEHSRVYAFKNGQQNFVDGQLYMGSADLMYRSFHNRVEVLPPIFNADHRRQILKILNTIIDDHRQVWEMNSQGQYERRKPKSNQEQGSHELLMQYYGKRKFPF